MEKIYGDNIGDEIIEGAILPRVALALAFECQMCAVVHVAQIQCVVAYGCWY
jgi:hypothetical protein